MSTKNEIDAFRCIPPIHIALMMLFKKLHGGVSLGFVWSLFVEPDNYDWYLLNSIEAY